jgi:hypothetical protein
MVSSDPERDNALLDETSKLSTTVSSETLYNLTYPDPAVTASLNVIIIFASKVIFVPLSSGDNDEIVGEVADDIFNVARLPDDADGVNSTT